LIESSPPPPPTDNETARRLQEQLKDKSRIAARIHRHLLILLHTRGHVTIDAIYEQARKMLDLDGPVTTIDEEDPNRGLAHRWDAGERDAVYGLIERYVAHYLSPEDVDVAVNQARRSERARGLEEISNVPGVSFQLLRQKVIEYCSVPREPGEDPLETEDIGMRVALVRHFLSDRLEFIGVAKQFLAVEDTLPIVTRAIGPRRGIGRVGGKAAGMVLANKIVREHFRKKGKKPPIPMEMAESYYLRSDLFQAFIEQNDLMSYYDFKYKPISEIRASFPLIREVFKNGQFSPYITRELHNLLEQVGNEPLIVRSSSLLEDNFGSAFSGKYESIFVANQGRIEDRLDELMGAIAEVYASTIGPDPILYRRRRNLIDYDEQMGILIQKVVGVRYRNLFFPPWAGVAFSRNEWRWSPRIQREDGLMRIVFGLGTRAVDRVGDDYPRMVPLGNPTLRPEISPEDIKRYSQRMVDVINLERNRFERLPFEQVVGKEALPDLHRVVSIAEPGMIRKPTSARVGAPPSRMVVTFDGLLSGPFPALMREVLGAIEDAYGAPMDVEFAYDGQKLYLLQARPQGQIAEAGSVAIPENIPQERQVFSASRFVPTGAVENIEYVVYIDPIDYEKVPTYEKKSAVGKVVGRLNERLEEGRFILMGPGRWGSNNIDLGVRVRYADIHGTSALIEIARTRDGYTPEVSFGTHFFQDLIEAGIFYLPLYPEEEGSVFNEKFLRQSPNMLKALLPDAADHAETIRVIHVPQATDGLFLHLYMNADTDSALAFLGERKR